MRRAVSRNEFGQLLCARGEIFAKMQLEDQSLAAYDEALSYTPNAPRLWRERAALLLQLGRVREAQQYTERALTFDKLDPVAWHQLGDIQRSLGNTKKAYDAYAEALKLSPRDALTWARYGLCQYQLGQTRAAECRWRWHSRSTPTIVRPPIRCGGCGARWRNCGAKAYRSAVSHPPARFVEP